jgi:cob(I)alamin adenosyltransferase
MTVNTMPKQQGFIHLYTGTGGGKTTSALGVAMRSLGQGRRVAVVQFMKGRTDIGEYKIQKNLKGFKVYQFGTKNFVNLKKPSLKDIELANEGLGFAKELMREKMHPELLILDEINLAAAIGLIEIDAVLNMLNEAPDHIDIYMTGRYAPKPFCDAADYVTDVSDRKRPRVMIARRGIDF